MIVEKDDLYLMYNNLKYNRAVSKKIAARVWRVLRTELESFPLVWDRLEKVRLAGIILSEGITAHLTFKTEDGNGFDVVITDVHVRLSGYKSYDSAGSPICDQPDAVLQFGTSYGNLVY